MASGIARGRVRSTAAVESRNLAVISQIMGWQRYVELVYCVLLRYWTSMLWSIDKYQNKVSADQHHVTISRPQVYSSSKSNVFEVDRWQSAGFFSLRLKCKQRTTFCGKSRLRNCQESRVMTNSAWTIKSLIFWDFSYGGPRETASKSRPNSGAWKTTWRKWS